MIPKGYRIATLYGTTNNNRGITYEVLESGHVYGPASKYIGHMSDIIIGAGFEIDMIERLSDGTFFSYQYFIKQQKLLLLL